MPGRYLTRSTASFLNLALRGLSIGSRFALLFGLAILLSPAEVGEFGLILATVTFGVMAVGAEFHTFSLRELLSEPRERWSFVIQHQILAYLLPYFFVLTTLFFLFRLEYLPKEQSLWFVSLLLVEHLSQELYRLLIVIRRPLAASIVLFLRGGAWVWVALGAMILLPDLQSLQTVFAAWLSLGIVALLIGGFIVVKELAPFRRWSIDYQWLLRGAKVAGIFLFGTLCLKALSTVDRFVVQEIAGASFLGVYSFYAGICLVVPAVLDATVLVFIYPQMVSAWRVGDKAEFRQNLVQMAKLGIVATVTTGLLALAAIGPMVSFLEAPLYESYLHVFSILLIGSVFFCLSLIPHYGLYAYSRDFGIVAIQFAGLILFCLTVFAVKDIFPFEAAAIASVVAFLWLACAKLLYFLFVGRQQLLPHTQ